MKNMRIPEYVNRVPEASHVARTVKWAKQHAAQIAQYNAWAMKREPYSQRVPHWRSENV